MLSKPALIVTKVLNQICGPIFLSAAPEPGEEVRQTATFIYNGFYTGRATGLTVDRAEGTNIFRVNDWASGVGFRFILNDDNTCTVPAQSIGYFNSNYNEYVYVSDMAV